MPEGSSVPEAEIQPVKLKRASKQLRTFSKEVSKDERVEVARAIKRKRAEHFERKGSLVERRDALTSQSAELDNDLVGSLEKLAETVADLDELSSSWYSRVLHFSYIRKLRNKVGNLQVSQSETESALQAIKREEEGVASLLQYGKKNNNKFEDAKKLLEEFYNKEASKWRKTPYSKEDIKRYFSEEYLTSLSMEDYAELLSRTPMQMVAHVTRQGVRDHTGHYAHTAGFGEYHDEFRKILQDGKLRSPLGVYLKDGVKKEAIAEFMGLDGLTKQRALHLLDLYRDMYADKAAVHMAIDMVADAYYGGEEGNEIFFSFPSAFIASNYYFGGTAVPDWLTSPEWNDQGILLSDDRDGININTGVVFIPLLTQVDPRTGSKYELDEDNKPIPLGKKEGWEGFKLASNTISSKEYWEQYFKENSNLRPKRIVWYSGDPTGAIRRWNFGLPNSRHVYSEFQENLGNPPNLEERANRFYEIGKQLIEERYGGITSAK